MLSSLPSNAIEIVPELVTVPPPLIPVPALTATLVTVPVVVEYPNPVTKSYT